MIQNNKIEGIYQYNHTDIIAIYSNGLDIDNAPSWFPKAKLSRTQTDLIARSDHGEEYIFVDYFTNHDLPSIQTENGLVFNGSLIIDLEILCGPS